MAMDLLSTSIHCLKMMQFDEILFLSTNKDCRISSLEQKLHCNLKEEINITSKIHESSFLGHQYQTSLKSPQQTNIY